MRYLATVGRPGRFGIRHLQAMSRATLSRGLLLGFLAGAAWLAVLSTWGQAGSYSSLVTVGIDMQPGLDGGSPENSGTSLGAIQSCTEAPPGQTITVDTYLDAIPGARDFASFDYLIGFEPGVLELSSSTHGDGAINLLASTPGSEVNAAVSDVPNGIRVVAYDFGQAERGPARGVLGRYAIEISPGATGVYEITLDQVVLFDSAGGEITLTSPPLSGQLVISPETCSGTEAPTPSPPTPSPTPSPTPVPEGAEASDPSPYPTPTSPAETDSGAAATGDVGERFLYPLLGFTTRITAFFDHTSPQGGPDGWMQVYTGDGSSDKTTCDSDPRAYHSENLGICLHYDGHAGYDFDLPDGVSTAVRATADGCAVDVAWDGALGFQIVLIHENGYRTQYGHLDDGQPHVSKGDCVVAGERIAYGGNTGCACGEHLHFVVLNPNGRPTDPYGWWGGEPDPWSPPSKWLWAIEQPTTNRLPVPAPEDAPRPLRPTNPCANQALTGKLPAVITSRSTFPCNA